MYVLGLMLSIGAVIFSCAFPQAKGSCKIPPRMELAELIEDLKQETFPMGFVVNYACRPGYSRYGSLKMICSEGKWQRFSGGECKKRRCGHPGDIQFGTFELKSENEFVFGAIVEYSCEPGYQMISKHKTIECTATGWSRGLPHCEAKLCPPITDDSVRVLSTVYDEEYTPGHVINLQCKNPNNKLNGPSQIHCTNNGTWNMDPPTCKGSCSVSHYKMKQHNIQVKNYQVQYVKHNERIEFECISRHETSDLKNLIVKCNAGVITYPTCHMKAKLCPPVMDDSVRVVSTMYGEEYTAGHVINLQCKNPNNKLNGPSKIYCTSNGTWNIDPPTCKAKLCPPVMDDSVRVVSTVYGEEYTAGHVINLQCRNPNNKLNGPSKIYCTSNGTWNIDPPTCKEENVKNKPCFPPPEILFGESMAEKKQMYDSGTIIQFKCVSYYKLKGRKQIKCQNGVWDDPPTCLEQKVKNKPCFPPPVILFGELMAEKKQMYDSGTIIQVKCVRYYKHDGRKQIKCQNGVWNDPPTCLVPCVINSNYLKGNNTELVNANEKYFEHSKTIKFKCVRAFGISDSKLLNVQCLNGTLKYPKCVKMEPCILNDNFIKGNNTVVNATEKHLEHGDTVKFKCLSTFKISDSKLLNVKCTDGKLNYPKCVKTGPCSLNETTMLENNITVKTGHKCGNQRLQNKCGIKENENIEFTCFPGYETSEHEKLKAKCLSGVIEYPKCFEITDEITVQPSVESEPEI